MSGNARTLRHFERREERVVLVDTHETPWVVREAWPTEEWLFVRAEKAEARVRELEENIIPEERLDAYGQGVENTEARVRRVWERAMNTSLPSGQTIRDYLTALYADDFALFFKEKIR